MSQRFFDTLDAYYTAVLNGDPIDCGAGATDGDHVSWLLDALGRDDLGLIHLSALFSSRVTTLEQANNVTSYMRDLFVHSLIFNIAQGGADESGIGDEAFQSIIEML